MIMEQKLEEKEKEKGPLDNSVDVYFVFLSGWNPMCPV